MYCPHCGVQNSQETRFCRGCGEDLRLVSQAVTKSLPLVIAQRVDDAIDRGRGGWRTYQMFRAENRKSLSQTMFAFAALFVVVWMLLMGHGSVAFAGGFLLVMTIALFVTSLHELLTRRRRERRAETTTELPASFTTKELLESHERLDQQSPAGSVTEPTTRKLKVGNRKS